MGRTLMEQLLLLLVVVASCCRCCGWWCCSSCDCAFVVGCGCGRGWFLLVVVGCADMLMCCFVPALRVEISCQVKFT